MARRQVRTSSSPELHLCEDGGPEGLASARGRLHAANLALRASFLLRDELACARPSDPPGFSQKQAYLNFRVAHGSAPTARAFLRNAGP